HVEGPVAVRVLGPRESVGLAGVDLAEILLVPPPLEAETRGDDRSRLHGAGQGGCHDHVGLDPLGPGQVVPQGLGLGPAAIGEAAAPGGAADHPVEPRVGIAVTDEDESHGLDMPLAAAEDARWPLRYGTPGGASRGTRPPPPGAPRWRRPRPVGAAPGAGRPAGPCRWRSR